MTHSSSYSSTYSVIDVRKVWDQVRADFRMAAQSTGLLTIDFVDKTIRDVVTLAEKAYLTKVHVHLHTARGTPVRGRTYAISEDASTWAADRSGSMLWPKTPGGNLGLTVNYSQIWWGLSDAERDKFESDLELPWSTSDIDTSFSGLVGVSDRSYASKAYGVSSRSFS